MYPVYFRDKLMVELGDQLNLEGKEVSRMIPSKKYNKLVNITKKKQTHRFREQTSGYQWGGGEGQHGGEGVVGTNY